MLGNALREMMARGIRSALDGFPNLPGENPPDGLHPRLARVTSTLGTLGLEDLRGYSVTMNRMILDTMAPLLQDVPAAVHSVVNRHIVGPDGNLPVRIYDPGAVESPAIILFFHGGGWVLGSLDSHDSVCRLLARESDCVVVSVEYRKAPEAPFPAAVEDARAALHWVRAQAATLNGREDRIVLAGDSAGGNLCAVLAAENPTAPVSLAAQLLFYPAVDILPRTESARLFSKGYLLTMDQIDWFRSHYLKAFNDYEDPRVSPLLADDFRALPPTLVVTAGFDPLRDDGKAYADKLQTAGVPVRYRCFDNMPHGFLNMTLLADEGKEAIRLAAEELRSFLSAPGG